MAHSRKESFLPPLSFPCFGPTVSFLTIFLSWTKTTRLGPKLTLSCLCFGFCPIGAHLWLEKDWQRLWEVGPEGGIEAALSQRDAATYINVEEVTVTLSKASCFLNGN